MNPELDYLQTEDLDSKKADQLALSLKNEFHSDPKKIVSYLKRYILKNRFIYTLKPKNKSKTIDQFLFKDKAGYCEHYASVFAYLLRKAESKLGGFRISRWRLQ